MKLTPLSDSRWWTLYWLTLLTVTGALAVSYYFFLGIPLELVVGASGLVLLGLASAYYLRTRHHDRRVNRAIYILMGITPIGLVLWLVWAVAVTRYITLWLGAWGSVILWFTIPFIVGALIGDIIGEKRKYRLPHPP